MKKILFILSLVAVVNLNVIAEDVLPTITIDTGGFGVTELYTYNKSGLMYEDRRTENSLTITLFNDELEEERTVTLNNVITNYGDENLPRGEYKVLVGLTSANDYRFSFPSGRAPFTQTLFNDDEKLEFIVSTIRVDENNEGLVIKHEIISEDGTVLATLLPETGRVYRYFDFFVNVIGNIKYLVGYSNDRNRDVSDYSYYKISNTTTNGSSNISIEPMPKNFAFPNPVKSNQSLTIQLSSTTTLSSESYVEMVSLNGSVVSRQPAKIFDNQISVSTRGISSGQYIYNVVSEGKIVDSGKIIVR